MTYHLVIFDFDGTLADTFPWVAQIANSLADTYHFRHIGPEAVERLRYCSAQAVLQQLEIPAWQVPVLMVRFRQALERHVQQIALFDGIGAVLTDLASRGLTLAVVSSNSEANVRQVLGAEYAGLITYYECGVSLAGKASRIKKILSHSRQPAAATLLIGDEIRDGEAARKVGAAFGAVAWGYTRVEALQAQAPTLVFKQPAEISQTLAVCPGANISG